MNYSPRDEASHDILSASNRFQFEFNWLAACMLEVYFEKKLPHPKLKKHFCAPAAVGGLN